MAQRDWHVCAGYGWVLGWVGEMAWQLLFLLQSPPGAHHAAAGSCVWQRAHRALVLYTPLSTLLRCTAGMWLCLAALSAALLSFAATLHNLYRCEHGSLH